MFNAIVMSLVLLQGVEAAPAAPPTEPAAVENTQTAQNTVQAPADPSQEVTCRNVRRTGTRMSTRVCMTRAQAETNEENALDGLRRIQDAQKHNNGRGD